MMVHYLYLLDHYRTEETKNKKIREQIKNVSKEVKPTMLTKNVRIICYGQLLNITL